MPSPARSPTGSEKNRHFLKISKKSDRKIYLPNSDWGQYAPAHGGIKRKPQIPSI